MEIDEKVDRKKNFESRENDMGKKRISSFEMYDGSENSRFI